MLPYIAYMDPMGNVDCVSSHCFSYAGIFWARSDRRLFGNLTDKHDAAKEKHWNLQITTGLSSQTCNDTQIQSQKLSRALGLGYTSSIDW